MAIQTGNLMDKKVSITQAKDYFSEMVRAAERGDVITVTRRGQAVVRLVSEQEYQRLTRRKGRIDWGDKLVDLSGYRFDREEANARG